MSSYLLCSTPNYGHVAPMIAIGAHLTGAGHRVQLLTGSRFAAVAAAVGVEHVSLPAGADFDDREPASFLPDRDSHRGLAKARYDIEQMFIRTIPAQHAAVAQLVGAGAPDAVLVDATFAGVLPMLVSGAPRPPVLGAGVLPLSQSSRDLAPYGMGLHPSASPTGRVRNAALNAVARRVLFRNTQALANRMLAQTGSGPLSDFVLDLSRLFDRFLQLSAAEFEYPRSDLALNTRFVGPVLPAARPGPLPDWWPDLDGSRPIVHVTQGTMDNHDPTRLIGPTVQAVRDTEVLLVVSTGGIPVERLGPLPSNVRAAEFLPYDQLFPRLDLMVTNGGYGAVQYALAHAVPLVAAGVTEDKPEVTARIAHAGVGINLKTGTPTPTALRAAIRTVLDHDSYRGAATRLAAASARYHALDTIEQELSAAPRLRHR